MSLKHGFDNVSIKNIQEESGLSAGSIYYHFKDKDEILVSILDVYFKGGIRQLKNDLNNFDGTFMEKLGFIFNYKVNYFFDKKDDSSHVSNDNQFNRKDYWIFLTSVYHQHPEVRQTFYEIHDEMYDFYSGLVKEAIEKEEIRDDIDIRTLVIFIQRCLKGYLDVWVYKSTFSFEEVVDSNLKMIWEAVKK